jgi:hypothetical protein
LYGLFCDVALVVPLVLYMVMPIVNSADKHAYHQTYINMIFSAYAPLGITWLIVAADDSNAARTALTGAVEMAGLGPFALFWVGLSTFFMQVKNGGDLISTNWNVWIYGPIYFVINILLIVMHYHLSAPINAWIKVAPLRANAIDEVQPWAQPEGSYVAPSSEPATVDAGVDVEGDSMNAGVDAVDGWNDEVDSVADDVVDVVDDVDTDLVDDI